MANNLDLSPKFKRVMANFAYEAMLDGLKVNHQYVISFKDIERNGTLIPSEWKITIERKA